MLSVKNSRTARIVVSLFALSLLAAAQPAISGEVNPYNSTTYATDSAGMLDAINRDAGRSAGHLSGAYGSQGLTRVNPYSSTRYDNDAAGLLDAVNRDSGRDSGYVASAAAPRAQSVRTAVNPYSFTEYDGNTMALLDAVNSGSQVQPARPVFASSHQATFIESAPAAAYDGYASSTSYEPIG